MPSCSNVCRFFNTLKVLIPEDGRNNNCHHNKESDLKQRIAQKIGAERKVRLMIA